jgi:hypothetical protein
MLTTGTLVKGARPEDGWGLPVLPGCCRVGPDQLTNIVDMRGQIFNVDNWHSSKGGKTRRRLGVAGVAGLLPGRTRPTD